MKAHGWAGLDAMGVSSLWLLQLQRAAGKPSHANRLKAHGSFCKRNLIHLPENGKDIELAVFEIRAECIMRMRLEHSSAARMCCLVCMAHVRLRAWLVVWGFHLDSKL